MAAETTVENFTTVLTHQQTKGRGQQHTSWHSKPFKNLTFSTLIHHKALQIDAQASLNYAVALAVIKTLKKLQVPKLSIKWPNDILTANKKLCGILIENNIQNTNITYSIVGIGLNVNQETFPKELTHATSIKNSLGTSLVLDDVLADLLQNIKAYSDLMESDKRETLKESYEQQLFRKGIPTAFQNQQNIKFMGSIQGVNSDGLLEVLLEDDSIHTFGLKELKMLIN